MNSTKPREKKLKTGILKYLDAAKITANINPNIPANTVRDTYDTGGNLGITSFTFVTTPEVATGGTLFGWGRNNSGNLGLGDESNR